MVAKSNPPDSGSMPRHSKSCGNRKLAPGTILKVLGILGLMTLLATVALFLRDHQRARKRLSGRSAILAAPLDLPSPLGDIEYSVTGSGAPVLVIHGAGGGFDQGELVAEAALGDAFLRISPSRFGYLRSAMPSDATWDMQADSYHALLQHLDIQQTAVLAISQGCPSALLFAARYPERVSALALISCGVAALALPEQQGASTRGNLLAMLFRHDFPYWLFTRLFERSFINVMGADDAVFAALNQHQQAWARQFIDSMNPVSLRSAGAAFDNRAKQPGERIREVEAPVLLFHAEDDTLQLYAQARFAARTLPNAELVSYARGGHLLLLVEQQDIRRRIARHFAPHRRAQGDF